MSLPDTEKVLLACLRSYHPDETVVVVLPKDWATRLPIITASRSGGTAGDYRLMDNPLMEVSVWSRDRAGASDTARDIQSELHQAPLSWSGSDDGWIGACSETSGPTNIGDPDDPTLFRFTATYQIAIRY